MAIGFASERYEVRAEWPEKLWKQYRLADRVYCDEYLFLCKDKVPAKKRNFDMFTAWDRARTLEREIEQRSLRVRSNPVLYQPFGRVLQAEEYLASF